MKLLKALFFLAFIILNRQSFSQAISFTLIPLQDSTQGCFHQLGVGIQTGALPESGASIAVDWGDGGIETIVTPVIPANNCPMISLTHGYFAPGTYVVTASVYSSTNQATVGAPQQLTCNVFDPANCGFVYIYTIQENLNIPIMNVPYDFTGADGITTTIVPAGNTINGNSYSGLNMANAPYTVSINDTWLTTNGLIQTSSDTTINSFEINGIADLWELAMTVACATPATNPDFAINYSFAAAFIAPLQTGTVNMRICNYACLDTSDASVTLECPAGFIPTTSGLTNAAFSGNVLTFDLPSLSDCIDVQIPFTIPGNTPAGMQFLLYATVDHPDDTDSANNSATIYAYIFNSYDPNVKSVNKPQQIDPDQQETLHYVIQFQNEGNFPATDVVIRDTISTNLDLATLTVLGAKHGIATSIDPTTRIVTFSFNDINLAPASQDEEASKGYVVYSIQENAGLPLNSEIENTAYIYFDFNPAIVTNTTYNINSTLGVEESIVEFITLYPNPANTSIQFKGAAVKAVEVFDMTGKAVAGNSLINANELSVAHLSSGVYQVVIHTEKRIYTEKLIIRK